MCRLMGLHRRRRGLGLSKKEMRGIVQVELDGISVAEMLLSLSGCL